ncbi:MAG: polyprenyl synthetase family protein [Chloroflexota bacterium]|nr:polyprenyl synthetase family protein [Chloroflexota bacterium]
MQQLESYYLPVSEDLRKVEDRLVSLADVDAPWLSSPLRYILDGGGKQFRAGMTLLAGKLYKYNLDSLIPMATAVELLHTASLVHDDAVDGSDMRRGKSAVHTIWGRSTAVLVGDYLFANAAELVSRTGNVIVMKLFANTLMTMANSELGESTSLFDLSQSREQYYRRIGGKTASLFSMATESGATLSDAPQEAVDALKDYGYNVGLAFQIIDDILDFTAQESELGKPVGADLRHGILTLPAILLLEHYPKNNPIKQIFENKDPKSNIQRVVDMIHNSPVINECYEVACDFCTKACDSLKILPDSSAKESLRQLTERAIRRRQ